MPSKRHLLAVALAMLAVAGPDAATGAPQALAPSIDALIGRYLDIERAAPADRVRRCRSSESAECSLLYGQLGGEYLELQMRLADANDAVLTPEDRLELDFLLWRVAEAAASYLDPDLSGYERLIWSHASRRFEASELHGLGLLEVERIRAAMVELVGKSDTQTDLDTFLEAARSDDTLYARDRESLIEAAKSISRRLDEALPALFRRAPSTPYEILAPPSLSGSFMAQYQAAGRRLGSGLVLLNPDPRQVPLFVLEALLLHEAVPGHHFQTAWTDETVSIPSWRSDRSVTAYVEGWGLYAESLGEELGLYRHPLAEFGRLNLEMWRAVRLVVDTGLHAFDWDAERATEFFLRNTVLPHKQVEIEVRRYLDNPGQAVAYKIGELHFIALRERSEEALGLAFNVRDFHEVLLANGPVPLRTTDRLIDEWIARVQATR